MGVFFGHKEVDEKQKQGMVNHVFDTVASKYDLMNDLSSLFLHRHWKEFFIDHLPVALSLQEPILDLASGTGDIVRRMARRGYKNLTACDINPLMLEHFLLPDASYSNTSQPGRCALVCANAETLPFAAEAFSACTMAFGLRNVTSVPNVLKEAQRVLKRGGVFLCLEFSKVRWPIFDVISHFYKRKIVPQIGKLVVGQSEPYLYLAESIERFLTQEELKARMREAHFSLVQSIDILGGLVAIHKGYKI